MADRIASSRIAVEIGQALGIDMTRVSSLKISFSVGKSVVVEVSRLTTEVEADQLKQVMERFELVKKQ
jgi:hypothetical protein